MPAISLCIDADRAQTSKQTELTGKKQRLCNFRTIQRPDRLIIRGRRQNGTQLKVRQRLKVDISFVNSRSEHGIVTVKNRSHTDPLAAVTGKDEGSFSLVRRHSVAVMHHDCVRRLCALLLRRGFKRSNHAVNTFSLHQHAVSKQIALLKNGRSQLVKPSQTSLFVIEAVQFLRQKIFPTSRQLEKRFLTLGREQQRQASVLLCKSRLLLCLNSLSAAFQHYVRVGAAEPKGVDAHQRQSIDFRQRFDFGSYTQPQSLEINGGIRCFKMKIGVDPTVLKREQCLCQTCHARAGFQMSQIAFHGTDNKRPLRRFSMSQHATDSPRFHRVPHSRTCSVGLNVRDARFVEPGLGSFVNVFEQLRLSFATGQCNTGRATVGIHRCGANHGINRITVFLCFFKILEKDDSTAFAASISVSLFVEHSTSPGRRQHVCLRKAHEPHGRQKNIHATRHSRLSSARTNAFDSLSDCHKTGRTSRIHRHARAMQIKAVADTVGDNGKLRARHRIGPLHSSVIAVQNRHVGARCPNEHGCVTMGHLRGRDTSVFEGFPCHLQDHALLGIKIFRLLGGHSPETGIEKTNVADGAAARSVKRSRCGLFT